MYLDKQGNKLSFRRGDRILFLQGPAGSFFNRLAMHAKDEGANIFHINFNLGDKFFNPKKNSYDFKGEINEWPNYLENFLKKKKINRVYMLNDCRPYHKNIISTLRNNNLDFYVFEDGYFRPNHLTLEFNGVNANSQFIYFEEKAKKEKIETLRIKNSLYPKLIERILYSVLSVGNSIFFKNYVAYRKIDPFSKLYFEIMNSLVYFIKLFAISSYNPKKKYVLVVMQLNDDTQTKFHSFFKNMEDYLSFVVKKIRANNANQEILIKAHPKDLYHAYKLNRLMKDEKNVFFIYKGDSADYLEAADYVIVNNSTSAIRAIMEGKNIFACGNSAYLKKRYSNISEMEKDLDAFLQYKKNTQQFVNLDKLKISSQIKGKFH